MTDLTDAERQLIALLRGERAKNFSVEIRVDRGRWYSKLWDHDEDIAGHGQGDRFSEAWDDTLQRSVQLRHEVTLASRSGCRFRIEVQDSGSQWREGETVNPPRIL
jgi:hypothetical protein